MKAASRTADCREHADRATRRPAPVLALRDAQHEDAEARRDEHGAEDVEARLAVVAALGEEDRSDDQGADPHGDVDEEDPFPRQEVDQNTAEQNAGSGTHTAHRAPRPEGDVALTSLAEHRRQDREGRGRDRGCAETLQRAGRDQRSLAPREPAQERADREDDQPAQEDAPSSEQVGEATTEQQEAAEDERVGRDHPLQVLLGESEVDLDRREGHVHDCDIENDHELHHAQERQCEPLVLVRLCHRLVLFVRRRSMLTSNVLL